MFAFNNRKASIRAHNSGGSNNNNNNDERKPEPKETDEIYASTKA